MRLDDYRQSDNVGDQRGQSFGGGGGGGGLGLILALVGSRFGIGGVIVVVLGAMLFGFNPFSGGGSGVVSPQQQTEVGHDVAAKACNVDAASSFSCKVLASAEDVWAPIFQQSGRRLTPAALIFYGGRGSSGCGAAQSAMGPFYCPTDKRIYLDTGFFNELQTRFGASGDFAQAYVIAHEFGHHIQDQLGTLGSVHERQQAAGEAEGNALQVRVELQADCYAGVYAANAKTARGEAIMQPGDVEEGLKAASAIGDDTLQRSAGRTPMPDSFTHGTSAERVAWLKRGLETGDPSKCDTFSGSIDG
jgi:predicted metalloprotease